MSINIAIAPFLLWLSHCAVWLKLTDHYITVTWKLESPVQQSMLLLLSLDPIITTWSKFTNHFIISYFPTNRIYNWASKWWWTRSSFPKKTSQEQSSHNVKGSIYDVCIISKKQFWTHFDLSTHSWSCDVLWSYEIDWLIISLLSLIFSSFSPHPCYCVLCSTYNMNIR